MKRILSLLLVSLCMVLVLTSCGVKFDKDAINQSDVKDTLTATRVTGYDDYTVVNRDGALVLFSKTDAESGSTTYKIYNVDKGAEVLSRTSTAEAPVFIGLSPELDDKVLGLFSVIAEVDDKMQVSLYTPSGTAIATNLSEDDAESVKFVNDCLVVGENVYRLDKETWEVKTSYTRSELKGDIPECTKWTDEYYYRINSDKVVIYDKEYNITATYVTPSYAEDEEFFLFDDGYVVCQYWEEVDFMSEKYDVLDNGEKLNLHTIRINPVNGKVSELDTDYVLDYVIAIEDSYIQSVYDDSVKNIAVVAEIQDRKLDTSSASVVYMSMNSKLKGDRVFELDGRNTSFMPLGNGYVLAVDMMNGRRQLLNGGGKVIGDLSEAESTTAKYILGATGIYDYELNKLASLKTADGTYEYKGSVGNSLVFSLVKTDAENVEKTEYYLFNGSFVKIAEEETWGGIFGSAMFAVKDTDGNYKYYSGSNTLVLTSAGRKITSVVSGEDYVLVSVGVTGDTTTTYYRIDIAD